MSELPHRIFIPGRCGFLMLAAFLAVLFISPGPAWSQAPAKGADIEQKIDDLAEEVEKLKGKLKQRLQKKLH